MYTRKCSLMPLVKKFMRDDSKDYSELGMVREDRNHGGGRKKKDGKTLRG